MEEIIRRLVGNIINNCRSAASQICSAKIWIWSLGAAEASFCSSSEEEGSKAESESHCAS